MEVLVREKVSVITPAYNAERFIEDTIKSVLEQTYENLEMIIVDDCSTDNTEKIIKKYMKLDNRIIYKKLEGNSGAAVVRNAAIEMATGRYIAFLDSDDLWDENKLEKQISFMEENKIGFSFTGYRTMEEDGVLTHKEISVPKEIDYNGLLKNTIIGCLTVIIDKEKVGEFRMPLIRAGQDTATWLSILKKGHKAYSLGESLATYRLVKGSISSNKFKALKRTWNLYVNIEKLGLIKSTYYFINYALNAIIKRV